MSISENHCIPCLSGISSPAHRWLMTEKIGEFSFRARATALSSLPFIAEAIKGNFSTGDILSEPAASECWFEFGETPEEAMTKLISECIEAPLEAGRVDHDNARALETFTYTPAEMAVLAAGLPPRVESSAEDIAARITARRSRTPTADADVYQNGTQKDVIKIGART